MRDDIIKRIEAVLAATEQDHIDEVTLDGNGVNSSEAALTLRWVRKLLRDEKTSEYWAGPEERY